MKYDGEGSGFSFYGGIHDGGSGSAQGLASIEDQYAIVVVIIHSPAEIDIILSCFNCNC
jgi:hypothetical protein